MYSNKNCVLVGVSIDSDKEAWHNAIRREKTEWLQLCDFKAQGSLPVLYYQVQGFPTYILISPEGKIACPPTSNIDELKKHLVAFLQ
ncbi:MAG: thioredoxin family protein [Bacteroidia bacterium]|nr:thioredoxin family protein [Bacteroidia bacterium]